MHDEENTSFTLTDEEEIAAKTFKSNHKHSDVDKGTIGGHISYLFTPTSVGRAVDIRCNICGKTRSITDYNIW